MQVPVLATGFLDMSNAAALLHLIDCTEDDIVGVWRTIRSEIEAYGGLARKRKSWR